MKIATSVHRAIDLSRCSQNTTVTTSIHIPPNGIIHRRIKTFLLEGIFTPGQGGNILRELYRGKEISHVKILSSSKRMPFGDQKRRVVPMMLIGVGTPESVKEWAVEHSALDRSKWNLSGGTTQNLPYSVQNGVQKGYYGESFRMYVTGLTAKRQLAKQLTPLIMTPERMALGQQLYNELVRDPIITFTGTF